MLGNDTLIKKDKEQAMYISTKKILNEIRTRIRKKEEFRKGRQRLILNMQIKAVKYLDFI